MNINDTNWCTIWLFDCLPTVYIHLTDTTDCDDQYNFCALLTVISSEKGFSTQMLCERLLYGCSQTEHEYRVALFHILLRLNSLKSLVRLKNACKCKLFMQHCIIECSRDRDENFMTYFYRFTVSISISPTSNYSRFFFHQDLHLTHANLREKFRNDKQ